MLVPPVRVMLCPLFPAAVREITQRSERNQADATLDCYTAVLSVVTQRSPHSEEERCVTRDDTKNGCVTDYCHAGYGMCKFTCFSACLNARVLCLSFNMANLCRLQVTWAPHVHKGRSTVVAILKGFKKKIEQRQYITSYVQPCKPLLKFSKKISLKSERSFRPKVDSLDSCSPRQSRFPRSVIVVLKQGICMERQ